MHKPQMHNKTMLHRASKLALDSLSAASPLQVCRKWQRYVSK